MNEEEKKFNTNIFTKINLSKHLISKNLLVKCFYDTNLMNYLEF